MKKLFSLGSFLLVLSYAHAQINVGGIIRDHVNQHASEKVGEKTDQALDSLDHDIEGDNGKSSTGSQNQSTQTTTEQNNSTNTTSTQTTPQSGGSLKSYQNYDFIPGNEIIFEDNFTDSQDGEFPSHWDLKSGQGVTNTVEGGPAFMLTDGNYVIVNPLMKTDSYLSDNCTIEFDTYQSNGAYGILAFINHNEDMGATVSTSAEGIQYTSDNGVSLSGSNPADDQYENYLNKWHHIAIGFKGTQMKVYVDQNRVLVVPNAKITPHNISFGGIGNPDNPIVFKNVRIALGGDQNTLGKILTDGKFMTHAITFDVNKATIKPESMGFLNSLVKWLKDNPTVNLEIDGHTDSDGSDAANLTLSQQRAEAVKTQLVSMGIDASRLTTKGLGETVPMADNATPEGKAQNRRVEFVKM